MGSGQPAYWTSKAAVEALSRLSAAELAGTGILTNAVCAYMDGRSRSCSRCHPSLKAEDSRWTNSDAELSNSIVTIPAQLSHRVQ
eukprot:gene14590-17060_t